MRYSGNLCIEKSINIDRALKLSAKMVRKIKKNSNNKKSRTIILGLTNYKGKDIILRKINKFKGKDIDINEDYCKETTELRTKL